MMKQKLNIAIPWILVCAWAVFIFFMSAHTGSDLNQGDGLVAYIKQWLNALQAQIFGPDVDVISSLAHFCEYFILGILLMVALKRHVRISPAFLIAIAIASAYGITDEIHQIFVPDRVCDPIDWLVDTTGATLGAFAMFLYYRFSEPRK